MSSLIVWLSFSESSLSVSLMRYWEMVASSVSTISSRWFTVTTVSASYRNSSGMDAA